MLTTILRKEHKNIWEKRTPLTPSSIASLAMDGYKIDVQSSKIRIFADQLYLNQSVDLVQSTAQYQMVIGIKEPPIKCVRKKQVHLCFSHTIKGQQYNMPLLQRFIDQQATLIDYELMADEAGKRTIAFGQQAGIAGAVDSLWIAGQKLKMLNKKTQLSEIQQTIHYQTIANLKQSLSRVDLQTGTPIRILIIGTGNVGQGAEKVCQWLGLTKLDAESLLSNKRTEGSWYCVVSSRHIHQRLAGGAFDYDEYLKLGKKAYKSIIESLLGRFDILLQASFWTDFYPRHLDNLQIIKHQDKMPWVVGDISCDINGSFACTKKCSTIDKPAFSYDAATKTMTDGINWTGVSVMSIDNLPCELSLDASEHFSQKLEQYTPYLMTMDLNKSFAELDLPAEIKRSIIVYRGELTEDFLYLKTFL